MSKEPKLELHELFDLINDAIHSYGAWVEDKTNTTKLNEYSKNYEKLITTVCKLHAYDSHFLNFCHLFD